MSQPHKKPILFPFLFWAALLSISTSFAQPAWTWARHINSSTPEYITGLAADSTSGCVIAVGVFNTDISTFYGSDFNGANGGGFVAKYDAAGSVLWAFKIGNNQDDACNGVAVDATGDIYVTGYLENIADVKGTSGSSTVLSSVGGRDMFIAKYNTSGQLLWARKGGGSQDDEGLSICVNNKKVFVSGYYTGSATIAGTGTSAGGSSNNAFIASYDLTGNPLWLADAGSSNNSYARSVTCDTLGVYLAGDFTGSPLIVYDSSSTSVGFVVNANPLECDAFVIALSPNGGFKWAKSIGSFNKDYGRGIVEKGTKVYLTGSVSASANFPGYCCNPIAVGASGLELFVAELDKATGNTNWVNAEQGNSDQQGMSIDLSTNGDLVIGGYFDSGISFNGGPTFSAIGNADILVACYKSNGSIQWATSAGSGGKDIAYALSCDRKKDEIYAGGEYSGNTTFGAFTVPAGGLANLFIAKTGCVPFSSNNISSSQTICSSQVPATLNGALPSGGSLPYTYIWEQSPNNTVWSAATGTNNLQNYSPPALFANTYYRRVVLSGAGCSDSSNSASVLITIDQPPTVSAAGTDQAICSNSSSFNGNTPGTGTGTWSLVSGTGSIGSVNSPTSSVTGLSVGQNIFVWTIANGACPSSTDTVIIKVDAFPSTSDAGPNQYICSASSVFAGNTPGTGIGTWTLIGGTGTITSVNSPSSSVTGLSAGNNTFLWTISNGSCPPSIDTVVIRRYLPPTSSNAGPDQAICTNSSAFAANTASVGTGLWTLLSGSGTFGNSLSPTSTVSGLSVGQNIFIWTISNGTCPPSSDTITIQVDAFPSTSNAGNNQVICSSSSVFSGNTPSIGTGTWSLAAGSGTITSVNSPTSSVSGLLTGTNKFVWTITNGSCPPSRDTVNIKVDSVPTTSNAGPDQKICSNVSAFAGNIAFVGTGTWTRILGSGTISSVNSPTSPISGLSVGVNVFVWTIVNGSCPPSRDTVMITVDALPSASNAGVDQVICSSVSAFAGNNPSVGTGTWTLVSGTGIITSANSPTSSVSGLSVGNNVFAWTINNGTCPSSKDTMTIKVDAQPTTANAGIDRVLCSNGDTLSGNIPLVGTGLWTLIAGTGTISNPTQAKTTVTGLSVGNNQFMWTITNGSCPPSRDTVRIQVDALPTISNAGTDKTICASYDTLSGNIPSIGTGYWTLASGSGTIANASAAKTAVTGLGTGVNRFVWTISNGSCPSSRDTMQIIVDAYPTASNAGTDQAVCSSSSNFMGNVPSIGSGQWMLVSGTGTISNPTSATSAVSGLSIGVNKFIWTITNGTCPPSVDTVSIRVDPMPSIANAGSNQILCVGSTTTIFGNVPQTGTGLWTLAGGTGTINSPTSNATQISGLGIGNNLFVWTITSGSCPPSRDTVVIHVDDVPTTADAGSDQVVYNIFCTLAANTPINGQGTWTSQGGTVLFTNDNDPATGAVGLKPGPNVLRWTISNGVCSDSYDEVTVTLRELTVPNGFSPNNDGVNDYFAITGLSEFSFVRLNVFNRWGNQVYRNSDYKNNWDGRSTEGKELTDDTYYYILNVSEEISFKGFIILKRE